MIEYTHGILKDIIIPQPVTNSKKEIWDNNIFTFDIEVSSAWYTPNRELIKFNKDYDTEFFLHNCSPFSLCYIWQFGINDIVLYGRELQNFKILLDELRTIVTGAQIWVHNLAYEFQFLLNELDFDKIFARAPHKVVYADWKDIRFRCSYFLTRLSLADWGKQHKKVQKLKGNLDYNELRTPLTLLTEKEYSYCENDILVMYYGLLEYRSKYTTVYNIPLTQTGEIRRLIKNLYKDDMDYHKKITELLPRNAREYELLKQAYQGGYTHANYVKVGRIIENVKSIDLTSSYPTVMCSEKFPMTPWFYVRPYELEKYRNDEYSLIVDVTFTDIKCNSDISYISTSKLIGRKSMIRENGVPHLCVDDCVMYADNGRLRRTKQCRLICTNLDLDIIEWFYDYKKIKFNYIIASKNDYLDEKLIELTLIKFGDKTKLKGVEGAEGLYLQGKQFINCIYGMMCTDLVPENVDFDGEFWSVSKGDVDEKLEELKNKPWKNYVAYQHGIFIAAYARKNLMKMVNIIRNNVIYCDTDSIKYTGNYDNAIEEYNREIERKLEKCLNHYNLNTDLIRPLKPNGEIEHLGFWDSERTYKAFITQGAKRYAYTYGEIYEKNELEYNIYKGDEIFHCTVSGINKEFGGKKIKNLEEFRDGLIFENEYCKRLILKYLCDKPPVLWNKGLYDEYLSTETYGVNAMPSTYSMSMATEFIDLLEQFIASRF